ncbi:CGNR zinc finger domain-containing protein [Phytohabitans sp. ZYX-F-186]|uniref:CGNR zinc finger domain-containing protein n=1 Tax=Phytohabitans maris TaxID=3071409 RepID=A0ABU0ZJL4_9ACTN|nr:CGNR zinc finger domain-containing protein [Phytohabitans sp. ZYX-F-186]MDQ7906572.1 CGNR zinc finger domain-containing protein [Phytohabitans sp. ZYX-F-186]
MDGGVPEQLVLVEAFANTLDVEEGTDELTTTERFQRWLSAQGREGPVAPADLDLAWQLRAALRLELSAHDTEAPADDAVEAPAGDPRAELDRLAAGLPLRARFTEGGMGLVPTADGVPGLLAEIVAAMVLAERDGIWSRLKICREGTCQWAYYDRSKNSSKCWCGASCGNRNKTRAYRQRRVVGSARA